MRETKEIAGNLLESLLSDNEETSKKAQEEIQSIIDEITEFIENLEKDKKND